MHIDLLNSWQPKPFIRFWRSKELVWQSQKLAVSCCTNIRTFKPMAIDVLLDRSRSFRYLLLFLKELRTFHHSFLSDLQSWQNRNIPSCSRSLVYLADEKTRCSAPSSRCSIFSSVNKMTSSRIHSNTSECLHFRFSEDLTSWAIQISFFPTLTIFHWSIWQDDENWFVALLLDVRDHCIKSFQHGCQILARIQ